MSNTQIPSDWGDWNVVEIERGTEFWALLDELVDDKSGFYGNRTIITEAYREGRLYGIRVEETDGMFKRKARSDPLFCPGTYHLLPCFCIVREMENGEIGAVMIWVHSRARRLGFGRTLVEDLNVTKAIEPLPGSEGFWRACGIPVESKAQGLSPRLGDGSHVAADSDLTC